MDRFSQQFPDWSPPCCSAPKNIPPISKILPQYSGCSDRIPTKSLQHCWFGLQRFLQLSMSNHPQIRQLHWCCLALPNCRTAKIPPANHPTNCDVPISVHEWPLATPPSGSPPRGSPSWPSGPFHGPHGPSPLGSSHSQSCPSSHEELAHLAKAPSCPIHR